MLDRQRLDVAVYRQARLAFYLPAGINAVSSLEIQKYLQGRGIWLA